jgi:hypothetical protein
MAMQKISPPLSAEERQLLSEVITAITAWNLDYIKRFPKTVIYSEATFMEWMRYCGVDSSDMPDDLFEEIYQLADPDVPFDLLMINLRDQGRKKNRVQVFIERAKGGGHLKLNSIGDIEPEDQM